MSRPVICDLPSSCCGGVNPLTRWVTTRKCEEPIAWPTSTVGLPSHGKQRKHHQVVAGPPDVTPAVDHHVRLATTPSIGIAGQNWAGSLPAFS